MRQEGKISGPTDHLWVEQIHAAGWGRPAEGGDRARAFGGDRSIVRIKGRL
jgi:hypothetical protein